MIRIKTMWVEDTIHSYFHKGSNLFKSILFIKQTSIVSKLFPISVVQKVENADSHLLGKPV